VTLIFRYRYALHLVLYALGFFAPWNLALHLDAAGPNAHLWGILAVQLVRLGLANYLINTQLLLGLAILFALAGAALRTWGTAYVGAQIVASSSMHTAESPAANSGILQAGPYAHLRNPLYLGTFLHTCALVLLMPLTGAIFTLVLITALQFALISGEETYLTRTLGDPYRAYCALVPRLIPTLRARTAPQGLTPHWPQAFLAEIYFWAVAIAFASAGWSYNAQTITKGVIIAFGLSILARAFVPRPTSAQ